jgi:hypothetical protein
MQCASKQLKERGDRTKVYAHALLVAAALTQRPPTCYSAPAVGACNLIYCIATASMQMLPQSAALFARRARAAGM